MVKNLLKELFGGGVSFNEFNFTDSNDFIYEDRRTRELYTGRQAREEVSRKWYELSNRLLKRI